MLAVRKGLGAAAGASSTSSTPAARRAERPEADTYTQRAAQQRSQTWRHPSKEQTACSKVAAAQQHDDTEQHSAHLVRRVGRQRAQRFDDGRVEAAAHARRVCRGKDATTQVHFLESHMQ